MDEVGGRLESQRWEWDGPSIKGSVGLRAT